MSKSKAIQSVYNDYWIDDLRTELTKVGNNNISNYKSIILKYYGNPSKVEINKKYLPFNIYIINKKGKVFYSQVDEVEAIKVSKVKNGMKTIKNNPYDSKGFILTGCYHLRDNYYMYFIYKGVGHDDGFSLLFGIIAFIVLFFAFTRSRIAYISKIEASVRRIAQGDLSCRVPLKFNNELRELAEGINYMAESLENNDEKKSEFLTNISHDLRTPLTTILGYVDMIKQDSRLLNDEHNKYIDIINRKGLFLKKMLDDFFEISKISSKDMQLEKQNINLNELIMQAVYEEVDVLKENDLEVSISLEQTPIYITGDSNLLYRAVNNLINNAKRYSRINTEIQVKIYEEKTNENNYVVISISNIPKDNINAYEIDNFFERLYKKDLSRNSKGSGIGLTIAKNIAELHNGNIKAEIIGERLFFKFYIPIQSAITIIN
jgi:signal transduction histidine kinase